MEDLENECECVPCKECEGYKDESNACEHDDLCLCVELEIPDLTEEQ